MRCDLDAVADADDEETPENVAHDINTWTPDYVFNWLQGVFLAQIYWIIIISSFIKIKELERRVMLPSHECPHGSMSCVGCNFDSTDD